MPNYRNRYPARRRFLKQSGALTAAAVALPLPRLASPSDSASADVKPAPAGKRRRPPR
jgi:hypothetical protein